MKNLIIILTLTTFISCSKSNEADIQYSHNIDAAFAFSVFNSENEDLLNPDNPNHLDVSKIKLFYVIDGIEQEVFNPNYDHPRNFVIFEKDDVYRIGVTLNYTETSDMPITYIKWNDVDTDTIEATFDRSVNSILQNRVWLNGEQIWERGDHTNEAYFILTK